MQLHGSELESQRNLAIFRFLFNVLALVKVSAKYLTPPHGTPSAGPNQPGLMFGNGSLSTFQPGKATTAEYAQGCFSPAR
jgi:hypothetical protein